MPLERSRQLIGGVWRYVTADQSDSPNGGSVPETVTVVDEVLFSDVVAGEGVAPSWPAVAPYRTIAANQIVLLCRIIVVEVFNDSGISGLMQVVNDPEGDSTTLSNGPNPTTLGTSDGAVWRIAGGGATTSGDFANYRPKAGPITPVVGFGGGFEDDGTTGRALVFTTLYTPA